jgi:hypothetical protein
LNSPKLITNVGELMDIKRKGRVSGVSQVAMVKNVRKGKLYL